MTKMRSAVITFVNGHSQKYQIITLPMHDSELTIITHHWLHQLPMVGVARFHTKKKEIVQNSASRVSVAFPEAKEDSIPDVS